MGSEWFGSSELDEEIESRVFNLNSKYDTDGLHNLSLIQ